MEFQPYSNPKDFELETIVRERLGGMGHHLHVSVKEGVVTLTGSAEGYQEKREIETEVKMIAGVHHLVDEIRVIATDGFNNHRGTYWT